MGKPVEWNEILLDDTYFPTLGPIRRSNFAVTPNPVLFGDTSKAGDSVAMTQLTQSDFLGGSGVHLGNVRTDTNRCWTSDLATHHHRAVCLPGLEVSLGKPAWAGATSDPRVLVEFDGKLWAGFDTKVGSWTDGGGGWAGAADRTLGGNAIHALVWNNRLYVIHTAGVDARTTGGVWTAVLGYAGTLVGRGLAVWDNKIWALSSNTASDALILHSSLDGATWIPKNATLSNPRYAAMKIFPWRDSTGQSALYVHTDAGLWIYDATNDRFLPTEVEYGPAKLSRDYLLNKQGPDGRLYTTTGFLSLVALQTGNPIVITGVGLDRDDGYPLTEDGCITGLAADENFVWAMVFGTNELSVRGYRGGWHKFYKTTDALPPFAVEATPNGNPMVVASLGGERRLFFAYQTNTGAGAPIVKYLTLPSGQFNPRFFSEPGGYAAGPLTLVTPWWPFESEVQQKIFGHIFVQAKNHTATETTLIEVAIDLDESTWFSVTGAHGDANPITSDGLKEFFSQIQGAGHKWIRWRFTQQRGGTTSLTPIMEFYTAEVMRVLGATYAYSAEIDLSKPHRDKTPEQLRKKLEDLNDPQVNGTFYKFSWQDELGGVRTHYGRISRESGQSRTGPRSRDGAGFELISIIIPYNRDVA